MEPRKNVDTSFRINTSERWEKFCAIQNEYNSRLNYFETKLSKEQYSDYMELRDCAARLVIAKDRLDFALGDEYKKLAGIETLS